MKKFFVEIGDKPLAVYFVIFVEHEIIVYSHIFEAIHNIEKGEASFWPD
jgi:hypothetical protein